MGERCGRGEGRRAGAWRGAWVTLAALALLGCSGSAGGGRSVRGPSGEIPQIDTAGLTSASVTGFDIGEEEGRGAAELRPMRSVGEMYGERWEMLLYAGDYKLRVKFEITNVGPGDFKATVRGYLERREGDEIVEKLEFKESLADGAWTSSAEGFELTMGAHTISGAPGDLALSGTIDDAGEPVRYRFEVEGKAWRPGSGWILFGDTSEVYYKNSHLATLAEARGVVERGGETIALEGEAIGFHMATNLGLHEMQDRGLYFRHLSDDAGLLIEWRVYETSEAYNHQPIGQLVIARDGVIVFESGEARLDVAERWQDPGNYNYTVPRRVRISARDADGVEAVCTYEPRGEPEAKDPLANLNAMERFVASQVAQPMDYTFNSDWRCDIEGFGASATIKGEGSFSVRAFR